MDKPRIINYPNFDKLKDLCGNFIDYVYEYGEENDELIQFIFEEAMKAFYGRFIFDWITKRYEEKRNSI